MFCLTLSQAKCAKRADYCIYQGLAILSPMSPSIDKHCVNLITITGQQLVPLAIKLWHNGKIRSHFKSEHTYKCECVCVCVCRICLFYTSSISLAWPCWSMGLMAFCSKPTEPGYSILLPNEWATRKLEKKKHAAERNTTQFLGNFRQNTWKYNYKTYSSPFCIIRSSTVRSSLIFFIHYFSSTTAKQVSSPSVGTDSFLLTSLLF